MDIDSNQIAVIGMAARLPGAATVDQFWTNLRAGTSGITRFERDRLLAEGADPAQIDREGYVPAKGYLADADLFDSDFFGYSPREADVLDPQQRQFLECAWEALEDAGCVPGTFPGRIGVFGATALNTYLLSNVLTDQALVDSIGMYQLLQGSDKDFLATRVAYKLGLRGPAMAVQTACSSSLTAVHLAMQSLLDGECDLAIAGGVSVSVPLASGYQYEDGGIASPDGHCRAFDAQAAGTVPGNGVGLVVLRRLGDAVTDGDAVRATILGSAVNNDGALKIGYTAPSVRGQQAVVSEALAVAGVSAETIGYVEAHGTGTTLGDPIEVAALTQAFRADTEEVGYCGLGSVKSNLGHLDSAAGIVGLIKVVLMLQHGELVPTLDVTEPNPQLQLDSSPFRLVTENAVWPAAVDHPRRAGVSSFGIGGTNVHLVLQEPPASESSPVTDGVALLRLSGKTAQAVADQASRLADHLEAHPEMALPAVARTLATRRTVFGERCAVAAADAADAVRRLRSITRDSVRSASPRETGIVFLFPGQGSQYIGMAAEFYHHEPAFAQRVDACAELFRHELGLDLRELIFTTKQEGEEVRQLAQTQFTQPALFLIEYSLADLLMSWGITPTAMVGHSIGEYVAACLAGVFTLPEAVAIVAARGKAVQSMPTGAMLSVQASEAGLQEWFTDEISLAAINSSELCALSGSRTAMADLAQRLGEREIACTPLHTSHAFHSPSMDAAVPQVAAVIAQASPRPPAIPFLSNITGTYITADQATDPAYWAGHLRATVRFADAVAELLADETLVFLEVGPGCSLTTLVKSHADWQSHRVATHVLPQPRRVGTDLVSLPQGLGELWSAGVEIPADLFSGCAEASVVSLPGYPFQRQRHWVKPVVGQPKVSSGSDSEVQLYVPSWQQVDQLAFRSEAGTVWLVVESGVSTDAAAGLVEGLARHGTVRVAVPGEALNIDSDRWTYRSDRTDDLAAVVNRVLNEAEALVVIDARPLDQSPDEVETAALARAFDLVRVLAASGAQTPIELVTLTQGAHQVLGSEAIEPRQASLTGLRPVISQEIADLQGRQIDLNQPIDQLSPRAVEALVRALRAERPSELALRGSHLWTRTFVPTINESGTGTRLRDGGVYLITGGLGGVGLALADQLARRVPEVKLALLSRRRLPERDEWRSWLSTHPREDATSRVLTEVLTLEAVGATVSLASADVTDRDSLAAALVAIERELGPINGVVHAAGAPGTGMIIGKSQTDIDAVFAAKAQGASNLLTELSKRDVDFALLCSSVNAVLGGLGQSDYAAANAYLDALADRAYGAGQPVTSVAWSRWEGVGMAAVGVPGNQLEKLGHPLLLRVSVSEDREVYSATFSTAKSWIVADHRLLGSGLVPGTAYLELVRAALAERTADRVLVLNDVLFVAPVIVPDRQERTVFVILEGNADQVHFTVRSRDEERGLWQDNALGRATFASRTEREAVDVAALRTAHPILEEFHDEASVFSRAQADQWTEGPLKFSVGPRWHVLRHLQLSQGHTIATLQLDREFAVDVESYGLHPALLDIAVGIFRLDAKDPNYLPLSYSELRYHAPLTSTIIVHTRPRSAPEGVAETLATDLDILDPDGRLLVEIEGYTVRLVRDVEALTEEITREVSKAVAVETPISREPEGLLVGMSRDEAQAAFDRILRLPELGARVVVARGDFNQVRAFVTTLTPQVLVDEAGAVGHQTMHPRPPLNSEYVAPRNELESTVVAIWSEVLGVDPIGVNDDFFALGGHSLAAVQIVARIKQRLAIEFELGDFYATPTVAHLSEILAAADGVEKVEDEIEIVERGVTEEELAALADLSDEELDAYLGQLLEEQLPTD